MTAFVQSVHLLLMRHVAVDEMERPLSPTLSQWNGKSIVHPCCFFVVPFPWLLWALLFCSVNCALQCFNEDDQEIFPMLGLARWLVFFLRDYLFLLLTDFFFQYLLSTCWLILRLVAQCGVPWRWVNIHDLSSSAVHQRIRDVAAFFPVPHWIHGTGKKYGAVALLAPYFFRLANWSWTADNRDIFRGKVVCTHVVFFFFVSVSCVVIANSFPKLSILYAIQFGTQTFATRNIINCWYRTNSSDTKQFIVYVNHVHCFSTLKPFAG